MITESGRVVAVEDNCLWVETIQRSTCDSCAAEKGCGQRLAARLTGHSSFIRVLLEGRDPGLFRLEDEVTIGIPDGVVANSSLFVYLVPLLMMIAGVCLAVFAGLGEGGSMLLAVAGFAGGAVVVKLHSHRHRNDSRLQPFLVDSRTPVNWVQAH